MPRFWDEMGPAYTRLPAPLPFAQTVSADAIGMAMVAGIGAVAAVHGGASYVRARRGRAARRRALRAAEAAAGGTSMTPDVSTSPDQPAELAPVPEPLATEPGPDAADTPAEEGR
jgi:hypothetical protein